MRIIFVLFLENSTCLVYTLEIEAFNTFKETPKNN